MHFRGSAIDGPFQLYNALRRIQGGFHPGVDFQYFHGLGIPFLHYPFYWMFGEGLRGSELARELISAASFPLVFLGVFRAFTGDWRKATCLTAAAIAAAYTLKMSPVIFAVNGMLGLRSALPTLLAGALFVTRDVRRRTWVAGIMLGLSLFLSTEQGLAALLAFIIVEAIAVLRSSERGGRAGQAAASIGIGVLLLVICLTAVGGFAGMRGALRFNFRLVPMDQYWYFGAPPNTFVPSWSAGIHMVMATPAIAIALFGGLFASIFYLQSAWRARDEEARRRAFAMALMSVYALISCSSLLGVFTPAYVQPCRRILLMIVLIEWTRYGIRADAARGWREWLGVPRAVAISTGLISTFALIAVPLLPATLEISLPHVVGEHGFGDARFSAGGIWPETLEEGQRAIDAHRGPNGQLPVLWSTYAGWLEARNGIFNPGTDYIIHALGPENRAEYTNKFKQTRPTLVQTVMPTYTQYEPWIENNHWSFYDELLRSYRVYSKTPWSFFWERRSTPAPEPTLVTSITVPPGASAVQFALPPSPTNRLVDLYEVEIDYTTHNPLAKLPVIGMTPRYLVGIQGAASHVEISMDPMSSTKRFPLLAHGGSTVALGFGTFSLLPGASWQPTVIRVRHREVDDGAIAWLSDLMDRTSAVRLEP